METSDSQAYKGVSRRDNREEERLPYLEKMNEKSQRTESFRSKHVFVFCPIWSCSSPNRKKLNFGWEHLATFTSEILEFQLFRLFHKFWARFLDVFNGWIWAQDSWSFQCMHPSKHSINIVWSMCFKYTNWFFPFLFVVFSFFLIPNINNNKKKNPDENGITFDKRDMREYLSVHATTLKVL